jgi:hypothetical protein
MNLRPSSAFRTSRRQNTDGRQTNYFLNQLPGYPSISNPTSPANDHLIANAPPEASQFCNEDGNLEFL